MKVMTERTLKRRGVGSTGTLEKLKSQFVTVPMPFISEGMPTVCVAAQEISRQKKWRKA